jgi:hypothetical protein
MSRAYYIIDGEQFDQSKSPYAFFGPYRRTRPLTVTRWNRLMRWMRKFFRGRLP